MINLNVTIVQTTLFWEDAEANTKMLGKKLSLLNRPTDVIVLPEMFNSGFTMNARKVAESMEGTTMQWMARQASKMNCSVTGSIVIKEKKEYHNRLIWMKPDGSFHYYDKRHLFSMAGENRIYSHGNEKIIVTVKGWRICPMICYDLRFPVWSRQTQTLKGAADKNDYDCLVYVANWPSLRIHAWRQLLIARAIENQCYAVGVNRVGVDNNNIYYDGYSTVLNFLGFEMFRNRNNNREFIASVTLSRKELQNFREEFPVSGDADRFKII